METKDLTKGKTIEAFNPSNLKEQVGTLQLASKEEMLSTVDQAKKAQKEWAKLTGAAKAAVLNKMAEKLEENKTEIATLGSKEMGKPIGEMTGEVMRGIQLLRYYAAEGMRSNGNVIPSSDVNVLQYSQRVPLGVVGLITPWNFPVAIPVWKFAPALISGNAVVWKPAENASLTAIKMMEVFEDVGLPEGVLNVVVGKGSEVGKAMLEESDVNAVSFTGSEATGRYVAGVCAGRNIKFQTEMGGKNAAIIMDDADLDQTIPIVLSGAFRSAGQKCTATSRIIVHSEVYEEVLKRLEESVNELNVAPAQEKDAYLGPVSSAEQYEKVNEYVEVARKEAQVIVEKPLNIEQEGYYVSPMIVTGVDSQHKLVQEEVFGPLAVVLKADDFDEAVQLTNDTVYGLSASIFTSDISNAHRFLDEAEAGMVRVNQETAGVEYQSPFGGMKQSSSHTREQGQAALDFYTQVKTCAIKYHF